MSNISVLSRISGVQQVVGAKTTPFVTTDAELVNDDKQHAALVRAIYNDQVSALSENSQILKPEDIASMPTIPKGSSQMDGTTTMSAD